MAKQHLGRTDYERLFVNTKAAWDLFRAAYSFSVRAIMVMQDLENHASH